MGYLYKAVCYPDLQTVREHYAADLFQQWGGSAGVVFSSEVSAMDTGAGSYTLCKRSDGGACVSTAHTFPTFSECDFSGAADMSLEAFGLALGFVVVCWVGSRIYNLFWGPHEPI